jgi:hypothetical protein
MSDRTAKKPSSMKSASTLVALLDLPLATQTQPAQKPSTTQIKRRRALLGGFRHIKSVIGGRIKKMTLNERRRRA